MICFVAKHLPKSTQYTLPKHQNSTLLMNGKFSRTHSSWLFHKRRYWKWREDSRILSSWMIRRLNLSSTRDQGYRILQLSSHPNSIGKFCGVGYHTNRGT